MMTRATISETEQIRILEDWSLVLRRDRSESEASVSEMPLLLNLS